MRQHSASSRGCLHVHDIRNNGHTSITEEKDLVKFTSSSSEFCLTPSRKEVDLLSDTGTSGDHGSINYLDPSYLTITRPHRFFKPGRVFSAIWHENAGPHNDGTNITPTLYGSQVFTKPARFICIKFHKTFSVALRIHSFSGRGEDKFETRPAHLFFVHAADDTAGLSALGTNKLIPIQVEDPDVGFVKGKSVVIASKPYSIEHFVKVKNIGFVVKSALPMLESALLGSLVRDNNKSANATGTSRSTFTSGPGRAMDVDGTADEDQDTLLLCDYQNCSRTEKPFNKSDHLRDHFRDFHHEDIPRPRGFSDKAKWKEWCASREVDKTWWRCKGCLTRVLNSVDGWSCPNCEEDCEEERIHRRDGGLDGQLDGDGGVEKV